MHFKPYLYFFSFLTLAIFFILFFNQQTLKEKYKQVLQF